VSPISGITKVSKFHASSFKLSNLKKDDRSHFRKTILHSSMSYVSVFNSINTSIIKGSRE